MSRVVVVHWHEAGCAERAARLLRAGHEVVAHWRQDDGGALTRALMAAPPDAIVIDLERLPSHGRAIAMWARERKALRRVPLVFVKGDPEKTARLQAALPDAVFTTWPQIGRSLARAIASPPKDPIVPAAPDYSGTPLPRKLGVKAGSRVAWIRAPHGFAGTLGELPDGVVVARALDGEIDVVVLFCRALAELQADFPKALRCLAQGGGLWVGWPKKSAGVLTDLTEDVVRAFGLGQGVVDNKVCAIDRTWAGLRFARRRR